MEKNRKKGEVNNHLIWTLSSSIGCSMLGHIFQKTIAGKGGKEQGPREDMNRRKGGGGWFTGERKKKGSKVGGNKGYGKLKKG